MIASLTFAAAICLAPDGEADMTRAFMAAIEELRSRGGGELELAPGDYHFRSASKRNWYVSNHDNVLPRDVFLPLENLTNATIRCRSRAEFVFHGNGIAIGLCGSRDVALKGIGIDYSRPFNTEWRFVGFDGGMPVLETDPAIFPFSTEGGVLRNAGECFHAEERLLVGFGGDNYEKICADWVSGKCERLSATRVKILSRTDRWRYLVPPKPGETLFVTRAGRRPAPAVFVSRTERVLLEDVIVRASPGMGVICQLSGDISIRGSKSAADRTAGAMPREGSGRVTSLQADATHFSNCRGLVTVENCTFERMCDDAINVHSTCLRIERLVPPDRLVAKFVHRQAKGFELFAPGETVRFIKARTLEAGAELALRSARMADAETYELEFASPLPDGYAAGDTIENADWQPEVRFANNVVDRNVSRAALFTTPRRVVCEGNVFSRIPGAAIKLSGDSMNWFESGGCRDVLIRSNSFVNCRTSYNRGVVIVDPEIASPTGQVERYHRNVVVEGNLFETHGVPLLWACSASNIAWRANSVVRNARYKPMKRKMLHFEFCEEATVDGVPAASHPDASVGQEHTLMILVSGNEEVAGCEREINDLADSRGLLMMFGNAQGRIMDALWDGRWEIALLDEDEATEDLLEAIAKKAPQLEVVIQTRRTRASDWPRFRTIAVGGATGKARAEIWVRELFGSAGRATAAGS